MELRDDGEENRDVDDDDDDDDDDSSPGSKMLDSCKVPPHH